MAGNETMSISFYPLYSVEILMLCCTLREGVKQLMKALLLVNIVTTRNIIINRNRYISLFLIIPIEKNALDFLLVRQRHLGGRVV